VIRWLIAALAVAAVAGCSSNEPSSDAPTPVGTAATTASTIARAVVDLTTRERRQSGLAALDDDADLSRAAQIHADQMASAGRLAHELPGARYPRLQDRLDAVDYEWQAIGENVAFGQRDAAAVVAEWMRSSGHRGNILNPGFTEIGVGYATDGTGRPYYVQVFARPR
jgi:uncharacterized protein YkwD